MRPKSLERSSTVECPQLKLLAVLTRGSCDWHLAITATVVRISAATVPDRRLTIMVGAIRCRPARTSSCLELLSIFQSALTTRLSLRILRVVRRRLSLRARVRRFRSLLALTVTTIFCRRAPASVCHTTVTVLSLGRRSMRFRLVPDFGENFPLISSFYTQAAGGHPGRYRQGLRPATSLPTAADRRSTWLPLARSLRPATVLLH